MSLLPPDVLLQLALDTLKVLHVGLGGLEVLLKLPLGLLNIGTLLLLALQVVLQLSAAKKAQVRVN